LIFEADVILSADVMLSGTEASWLDFAADLRKRNSGSYSYALRKRSVLLEASRHT
jgi:hypothetical protein